MVSSRRPRRRQVAAAPAAALTPVSESLHLLRFPPSTPREGIAQCLDGLWSLQYMAAGPICGSAGPLLHFRPAGAGATGAGSRPPPYTHAVLFRYASDANLERFAAQPRVQLMLGGSGAPPGTGITTIHFRGAVPSELEAIFRRGSEWDTGLELLLPLQLQGSSSGEEAAEFLSLAQQLALSSAFGAVQCSFGPCLSMQHSGGSSGSGCDQQQPPEQHLEQQQRPDMMLLARFQEQQQLQQFMDCPPVAALLEGDERLPLRALWSCALEVAPSDSASSQGLGGGLM